MHQIHLEDEIDRLRFRPINLHRDLVDPIARGRVVLDEPAGLRWRDVDLVDGVIRVRTSKTEDGVRSVAVSPRLSETLALHKERTPFDGDDELVFAHPAKGSACSAAAFSRALRAALTAAKVEGHVRAFHDLRHTAITNDAASGSSVIAVMAKAGHADMKTTKRYLHLAGVVFRDEPGRLEDRLLGPVESSTDLSEPERI